MIVQRLGEKFGKPEEGISKYEANAPFTLETNNLKNLEFLKNTEVRFYTEPDIKWWKENRQDEYEEMNAFYIKKCVDAMNEKFGNRKAIYYPTENRGYRANGVRHPHSWAIVDEAELVKWILK